jgi:hypothetical protein
VSEGYNQFQIRVQDACVMVYDQVQIRVQDVSVKEHDQVQIRVQDVCVKDTFRFRSGCKMCIKDIIRFRSGCKVCVLRNTIWFRSGCKATCYGKRTKQRSNGGLRRDQAQYLQKQNTWIVDRRILANETIGKSLCRENARDM